MKNLFVLALVLICTGTIAQKNKVDEVKAILKNIKSIPDWTEIQKELLPKYGAKEADSIVLVAKVEYYWKQKDYAHYFEVFFPFVQQSGKLQDVSNKNSMAWRVFEYASAPEDLAQAKKWIVDAVNADPGNGYYMDTYANILYKSGKLKEALKYETMAAWTAKLNPVILENLYKMKAGLSTWKYPVASGPVKDEKSQEFVWSALRRELTRTVDSALWATRLSISKSGKDSSAYMRTLVRYVEEFKPYRTTNDMNTDAWAIFQYSNNKSELTKALGWSKESLKDEKAPNSNYAFIDTYANLLYKLGNQKEAIFWEEKALSLCPADEKSSYEATLDKMKKGERTW
jgi:tetratricopeptide (TPR) repeat protein